MIEMIHMSDIVVETINNNIGIDSSEFKVWVMATTTFYGSGISQEGRMLSASPLFFFPTMSSQ